MKLLLITPKVKEATWYKIISKSQHKRNAFPRIISTQIRGHIYLVCIVPQQKRDLYGMSSDFRKMAFIYPKHLT